MVRRDAAPRPNVGYLGRVMAGLGNGVFAYRMAANGGKPPKDFSEKAFSTTVGASRVNANMPDYNPDVLLTREGLKKYDAMRRDETVKGVLAAMKSTRLASPWHLEPASQEPPDQLVVEQLLWDERHMKGTFRGGIKFAMSSLDYGFSTTEVVLELAESPWGRRVTIKRFAPRQPHSITFYTDGRGNILEDGIEQMVEGRPVRMRPDDFLLHSFNPDWDNPYGTSHLQAAYRSWLSKDWLIKWQNLSLNRFGDPILTVTMPEGVTDNALAMEIIRSVQAGTGGALPFGYILGVTEVPSAGEAFEKAIKLHNAMIACALLQPNRLGFVDFEGGSYNLAEVHMNLWRTILDDYGAELADGVMTDQLLRRQVLYNNGPDVQVPRFVFDPMTAADKMNLVAKIIESVKAGLLTWTYDDEAFARAMMGAGMLPEDVKAIVTDRTISDAGKSRASSSSGTFGGGPTAETFSANRDTALAGDGSAITIPGQAHITNTWGNVPEKAKVVLEVKGTFRGKGEGGPVTGTFSGTASPPRRELAFSAPSPDEPAAIEFRRALSMAEERVEFGEVKNRLLAAQAAGGAKLSAVVRGIQDDVLAWASGVVERKDEEAIARFSLPGVSDIRRAVLFAMCDAYAWAKKHARDEVERAMRQHGKPVVRFAAYAVDGWVTMERMMPEGSLKALRGMVPMAASEVRALRDHAFWLTGIEKKRLAADVKSIVREGMKSGDWAGAETKLQAKFAEYIEKGQMEPGVGATWADTGPRAKLVMQNAVSHAYNDGRMTMFRSPEIDPYVRGYEWCGILDDHICEYCYGMDGMVFEDKEAFEPPPSHHGDRCFVVAVVEGDEVNPDKVVTDGFNDEGRDADFN